MQRVALLAPIREDGNEAMQAIVMAVSDGKVMLQVKDAEGGSGEVDDVGTCEC